MSTDRFRDDAGRADERVWIDEAVAEDLDAMRQRWAAEARAAGREADARALEADLPDPLDELRRLPEDDVPFKGDQR